MQKRHIELAIEADSSRKLFLTSQWTSSTFSEKKVFSHYAVVSGNVILMLIIILSIAILSRRKILSAGWYRI